MWPTAVRLFVATENQGFCVLCIVCCVCCVGRDNPLFPLSLWTSFHSSSISPFLFYNLAAIKLYEKFGMKIVNEITSYYAKGKNAYTMQFIVCFFYLLFLLLVVLLLLSIVVVAAAFVVVYANS